LKEETNLDGKFPELVGIYGDPNRYWRHLEESNTTNRDPRKHTVSAFYLIHVDDTSKLKAGDDAADAKFYSVDELQKETQKFAFDHSKLFKDLLDFKKKK
jgi:8-oxo-dGTP diphosphatase